MKVTTFNDATSFLDTSLDYLEAHEVLNGLMLGIAFRLSQSAPRRRNRPFLAVVEDGGELVGAALMTPPRKMVLYSQLEQCQPVVEALNSALAPSVIATASKQMATLTSPVRRRPAQCAERSTASSVTSTAHSPTTTASAP